jgi:hypothetical protein
LKNLKTRFKSLSRIGQVATVAIVSVLSLGVIGAMAQPSNPVTNNAAEIIKTNTTESKTSEIKQTPSPKIEIKPLSTTESIPYTSSTVNDNSLDQGTAQVRTKGVNGVLTHTYQVTYKDGVETSRSTPVDIVTVSAVNEVIAIGTKAPAPTCENGTYVNSDGNTVCNPYSAPSAPAGATAQCSDGSYSFSQSRSGTCSHHGGVAAWL